MKKRDRTPDRKLTAHETTNTRQQGTPNLRGDGSLLYSDPRRRSSAGYGDRMAALGLADQRVWSGSFSHTLERSKRAASRADSEGAPSMDTTS